MKKTLWIAATIFSICASSCNEKKNSKKEELRTGLISAPYNVVSEGDGRKFNYDSLSTAIIDYGVKSLQQANYKFPEKEIFQKRISAVYGVNITGYQNEIIALRRSDFPEVVIKNENYILIQDSDADNDFYISPDILVLYNKYIFKEDKSALNLLKAKDPYLLKDLVVNYGYNGDKNLMEFVLKDFSFDNVVDFHSLIFNKNGHSFQNNADQNNNQKNNPDRNNNSQFVLRKGILDDIENIVYKGKTQELRSEAKEGHGYDALGDVIEMMMKNPGAYHESEQGIAFLCEKSLNVGDLGTVQSVLYKHQYFKHQLAKAHYYNFERLRIFCENLNVTDNSAVSTKSFTINDPDGYTNLRKEKNAQSAILQKVKSGETITVLEDTGDWFLVKTKEGREGYVHKSRIH